MAESLSMAPALRWPPPNQPVCGRHLAEFREQHDYTVAYLVGIFGLSSAHAYYRITKQADQPIKDIATAILLRYYAAHPECLPYRSVSPRELADDLGVSVEQLAISLGRVRLAGQEWARATDITAPLPVIRNLLYEIAVADSRADPVDRIIEAFDEEDPGRVFTPEQVKAKINKITEGLRRSKDVYEELRILHEIERKARGEAVPTLPERTKRQTRRRPERLASGVKRI